MRSSVETHMLAGVAADGLMQIHVHVPEAPVGIALIAHGRNGGAEQNHIRPITAACLAHNLVAVVPDLCNSAGNDAAGEKSAFTMAGHVADLSAVLQWLNPDAPAPRAGGWVAPPFATGADLAGERAAPVLIGHSMGAYATCRLAGAPDQPEPRGLLAISPVRSGPALLEARHTMGPKAIAALQRELPHAFEEWPDHDLAPLLPEIACPSAVIVGARDTITTPKDAWTLARALSDCVRFDVLPGEHHCPLGDAYATSIATSLELILAR